MKKEMRKDSKVLSGLEEEKNRIVRQRGYQWVKRTMDQKVLSGFEEKRMRKERDSGNIG